MKRAIQQAHVNDEHNPQLERAADEECLATWWHQRTPGTTYWRCLVPARHLPGQTLQLQESDLTLDGNMQPTMPRQRGTAIWQFLGDVVRSKVALGMRDLHGTRTLMEVDDNYLRSAPYLKGRPGAPWKDTIAESLESGSGYSHEMHRRIVPVFDGIICATEFLADKYYEYNENVYVCPNSIDPDDWQYEREEHDPFRIVYYGSYSHRTDTPLISKAMKWASKQPGVEVWVVGFDPIDWSFPHAKVPWTYELPEARKTLFRFDLGVAPLKANPWSNAKSDIKSMEYAVAGVCPLMSDAVPYESFRDCDPDLLVKDGDWEEAIRFYVKNQDVAREKAAKAKEWVLANRTIDKTIHLWKEAING